MGAGAVSRAHTEQLLALGILVPRLPYTALKGFQIDGPSTL